MFAPKQYLLQKEALGMQRPKFFSWAGAKSVRISTKLQITRNHVSPYRTDNANFRNFVASYHHGTMFCTKSILISKGSFRNAEHENIILGLVQKGYKPLRGFKLPAFMYRHIGPTMQISETSGLPIAMVLRLHHNNVYVKR